MEPTDRKAFATAMVAVGELYGQKLSAERGALYWEVLKGYPLAEVQAAMHRHMADPDSGQFMPKPADIIRHIAGSTDTQAMRAWTKAEKAMRTIGSYQTVVFDDWRIHAVVRDMGGWIALCGMTEDEKPFKAREFEKRYRGYRHEDGEEYPRALIGRAEAHNGQKGFHVDPPLLLGDQDRARLTYEGGGDAAKPLQVGALRVADLLPFKQEDNAA